MPFLANIFGGGGGGGAQPAVVRDTRYRDPFEPQMPGGGMLPGGMLPGGMPMMPGPGGGSNPMQGIIQMLIQQMMQQFMGRQQPSTFTPGGPGAPEREIPGGPARGLPDDRMRIQPFPFPGGGRYFPLGGGEMKMGVNPIADAQGPMGEMQGPMSFLSQFMNMRKPLDASDREFVGKDRPL